LKKKLSDKDKKDWENFLNKNEKLFNKDILLNKDSINKKTNATIDLHGYTLKDANSLIKDYIYKCYNRKIDKITIITGKGLRSKNKNNPYQSEKLNILKYSVPEFISSDIELMKIIKNINFKQIEDSNYGYFEISLKKIKE